MSSDYSGKLRVRSCGILVEEQKVLLVELKSPITNKWTWLPPGGGVQFGETLEETLLREFKEETGLEVSVKRRLKVNEIVKPPIHAIEFYFLVERITGRLILGSDPEHAKDDQIIRDLRFFSMKELDKIRLAPHFLKKELESLL